MAGKRHHYLPAFLLRRFAEPDGKRKGLVWRLDKASGQPRPVAPKYEAALPNYYRLQQPDGTTDSRPEDLLATIEGAAAALIQKLEEKGARPTDEERAWLALFVVLQHRRTPVAREWLKFYDEMTSTLQAEVHLENADRFHTGAKRLDPDASYDEVETARVELLGDLRSGDLKIESTPSREVAAMFTATDKVAEMLVKEFSWAVVRAPEGAPFVLPDMGITMYDPTPKVPGSGAAFASSPNAETVLPVDPSFAIAIMPGSPGWGDGAVDARAVEDVNLRAYAWSDAAVYGQSQKAVCDLRTRAKRDRQRFSALKPRPGRIWITEVDEDHMTGEMEFVGHSPEGTTRQRFLVHPQAYEDEDDRP